MLNNNDVYAYGFCRFIKKGLYKARLRFIYKSNYPKMQSSWTLI